MLLIPSSSGGDSRNKGQNPLIFKLNQLDQKKVDYTKNPKFKTSNKNTSPSSPISPILKHILNNSPILNMNINNQNFYYKITSPQSPLHTAISL